MTEQKIVAECWTCRREHLRQFSGTSYAPKYKMEEKLAEAHRAAGHDVRPVREAGK